MPFLAPIAGAIAGAVGAVKAVIAGSAILTAVAQIAGSVLLSAAASKIFRPKAPTVELRDRLLTVRQPVSPHQLIYGTVRTGGTIVFLHSRDSLGARTERRQVLVEQPDGEKSWVWETVTLPPNNDKKLLDLIIALAPHPVHNIGAVYFDGELAITAAGVAVGRWAGKARVIKRLGLPDQPQLWELISVAGDVWTPTQRLRGAAYAYIGLDFDADAYPQGIPNITFDVQGKSDILDPRTGARVFTDNPALCVADYLADPIYGLGATIGSPVGIDADVLIESANICDGWVARAGAEPERRYTLNGLVDTSVVPRENVQAMLTAMAGRAVWQGGAWRILAGAYRAPSVTLTADDVRRGGLQIATRVPMRENFNSVRGKFISPESDWQPDDFPPYRSAVYRAEDGGEERWADIVLPFTTSPSMAQRLAKIELERARRQSTVRFAGKLSAWRAATGETVLFEYARAGFASKPFEVTRCELTLDGGALATDIVLRETSPEVYNWSATEEQIYAAAPRTNLPSAFAAEAPGAPQVVETLYATRDGTGVRVVALVSWDASPAPTTASYELQMRRGSEPWTTVAQVTDTSAEVFDVAPGAIRFRVRSVSPLGLRSAWSPETALTVRGLGAPPPALTGLSIQSAGGTVFLRWDQSPRLDVRLGGRIEIRHSEASVPGWASSTEFLTVPGAATFATGPLRPGTYALRAYNAAGTAGAIVTISTAGATALAFAPVQVLTEDPDFDGAKTGVVEVGGALFLTTGAAFDDWPDVDAVSNWDAEGGYAPSGTYDFDVGMDLTTSRRVRLRSEVRVSASSADDDFDSRIGPMDDWASFDGVDGAEVNVTVEVRTTTDDPAGSPVWTAWGRADATEVLARGVEARAILTTRDPTITPLVTRLRLHAEEVA